MPNELRFRDDGSFTVVQFTDLHYRNGEPEDLQTRRLMGAVLEAERPDLVALTGDVLSGGGCDDPAQSWKNAVLPMEERGIPWAAVFGNHDDEGPVGREGLMDAQLSCAMCLSEPGPEDVSGVGNYTLAVESTNGGTSAALLYFIDSNAYAETDIGGYGWVRRDQIEWYISTGEAFKRDAGKTLPALAFFHIPVPEYDEVWDRQVCYGVKYENVCPPRINTGLFAAMHETGDVMGTFVGHDHVNDYWGELHGIRLCYGRGTGYHTYGRDGFPRGARIIRLREGERDFTSWLRLAGGERVDEQPCHEPQGRVLTD